MTRVAHGTLDFFEAVSFIKPHGTLHRVERFKVTLTIAAAPGFFKTLTQQLLAEASTSPLGKEIHFL